MAKEFPPANLQPCGHEVPLTIEQLLGVSLLARLPDATKTKLRNYPGFLRLRRCQKGEEICCQGAEDCTAFFILKEIDLYRLRYCLRTPREGDPAEKGEGEEQRPQPAR